MCGKFRLAGVAKGRYMCRRQRTFMIVYLYGEQFGMEFMGARDWNAIGEEAGAVNRLPRVCGLFLFNYHFCVLRVHMQY